MTLTSLTRARPAAVLWDMDGTIVDSEGHWLAAAEEILREHGIEPEGDALVGLVGVALPDGAELMRRIGVAVEREELVDRWIELALRNTLAHGVAWRPGALGLLAELRRAGIPLALVTMSYRVYAERVVEALPAGTFTVTVTGDDVARGKPSPDAYLRAAGLLRVDPRECVAIEDSLLGLASARAAGAHTIGVPHHLAIAADDADVVWSTLAGRGAADLHLPLV